MTTRKKKTKPFWERGYDTHGYWQGNTKIGWVALEGKGKDRPVPLAGRQSRRGG